MSEPNEPPLEVAEYNIIVKWSDGNEEIIPKDFYNFCKDLQNIVDEFESIFDNCPYHSLEETKKIFLKKIN